MKKKILVCLMAMLILTVGIMPCVHAEKETLMVNVGSATAYPGGDVEITLALEDNPGFSVINPLLIFNTEALTMTSVSAPEFTVKIPDIVVEGGSAIVLDREKDYTGTDVFATVTFHIAEDAELGNYEIHINPISDASNSEADTSYSVEGTVGIITVAEKEKGKFVGAGVNLGEGITVAYYAQTKADAQVRFTMGSFEETVDGVATETEGLYKFNFENIPPQKLGDNIKAELIVDGNVDDTKAEYSVLENCNNLKAKTAENLKISSAKYEKMLVLIDDMLEYGAASQLYQDYKTDNLVNADTTNATEFVELTDDASYTEIESSIPDFEFVSATIRHSSFTNLVVKFNWLGADLETVENVISISAYEDNEAEDPIIDECGFTVEMLDEETGLYALTIEGMLPTMFDYDFFVEFKVAKKKTATLEYSVSSYVFAKQNSSNTKIRDLSRALYNYGLSTTAYVTTA